MAVHELRPELHRWDDGIRTHVRVISALVRREMRAHFESRIGYLWALLTPALHLGSYMLIFSLLLKRHVPLGTSIPLFMLTGIVPYFLYSKLANYVSGAVGSNRALLILPPVKLSDVIVARVTLESATYLFVSFMMFIVLYLIGVADAVPHDPLPLVLACGLAVSVGLAIGLINIVLCSYFHNWMIFFGMSSFPLWFFSGIWFLPEQIPPPFRDYVLYNPILHIVLLFRTSFYWGYRSPFLDVNYVIGVTVALLTLGLALMQICRRRVLDPL